MSLKKIISPTTLLFITIGLVSCGGGSGGGDQNADIGSEQSDSSDNDDLDSGNTTNEQENDNVDNSPLDEVEVSIGEVLVSEDYPADGTGSAILDVLKVVEINDSNIAFTASYTGTNGERSGLWIGEINDPKLVLLSGTTLPIPSEDNQYVDAFSLEYFDDGALGVFFARANGSGYMAINGTNAFPVVTTGITLAGILEPRTVTGIERVAHSGSRSAFVARTELGFSAGLWQVEGATITPIASTYPSDFDFLLPQVGDCSINLVARDTSAFPAALASRDIPNIGLTESGAILFMAELSGSSCSESGVDVVKYDNGVFSRMMLSSPSLGHVFPDGSFIFNGRFIRTASGDIVDITDPSLLGSSPFVSTIEALTVEAWLDRPADLSIDTRFNSGDIQQVGVDGSVIFESSLGRQQSDKLSNNALWILQATGEVIRIVSDEDLVIVRGENRRVFGNGGYVVVHYVPNEFVIVSVKLGDALGNFGNTDALLKIDLE